MIKITWKNGPVPQGMKVTQVYGIIFTKDGRLLLKVENKTKGKVYSFAGGTPESFDADQVATLKRELLEEINTTIYEPIYVGYQEIDEGNGKQPYAQVRMTAMIKEIGEVKPDPDNGETYERLLTTPEKAIQLLGWGDVGKSQIEKAAMLAKQHFNLTLFNESDELV